MSIVVRGLTVLIWSLSLSCALGQAKPAATPAPRAVTKPGGPLLPLIKAGQLDVLRWPDFSDYRLHLENFYRPTNLRLAWIEQGAPTNRALEMIKLLDHADREGLNPEDYDSLRWPDRIAQL